MGGGDSLGAGSAFAVLARAVRHAAGVFDGDPPETCREKIPPPRRRPRGPRPRPPPSSASSPARPSPTTRARELRAARADPVLMGDQSAAPPRICCGPPAPRSR